VRGLDVKLPVLTGPLDSHTMGRLLGGRAFRGLDVKLPVLTGPLDSHTMGRLLGGRAFRGTK